MAAEQYFAPAYFEWQSERALTSARTVVPLLVGLVRPRSVVDLGCGTAAWLQAFTEGGVDDVVGLDGPYVERADLRIPPDLFVACDLAQPPPLHRRFDLALSLEAVHYLEEPAAVAAVQWLAAHADIVYFGAAVPFQEGGPGLTRRWPAWWAARFEQEGLHAYDVIRRRVWEEPHVDWWYAQNGVLYARDGALGETDRTGAPLPLVHPGLLADVAERSERPESPPSERLPGLRARLRRVLG